MSVQNETVEPKMLKCEDQKIISILVHIRRNIVNKEILQQGNNPEKINDNVGVLVPITEDKTMANES